MNAPQHKPRLADRFLTRRDFLGRCGMGFGMLGLANLLGPLTMGAALAPDGVSGNSPLSPKAPHFPAKAQRVIHIFANGGPSHVDTFDPKPMLARYAGQPLPFANLRTERRTGAAFPSPWRFRKYGQSGIEVSDLFPNLGRCVDDMCIVRSMYANVPN